jgi:hypothetical protein
VSRTAQHVPRKYLPAASRGATGPRAAALTDLRYSTACLRAAARGGLRPIPARVVRAVPVRYPGTYSARDSGFARQVTAEERKARRRLAREATAIRQALSAEGLEQGLATLDSEITPVRHRHNAIWCL